MKNLFSITAVAAVVLNGADAPAAELTTFELMGFPITSHQVAVIGAADVQEHSTIATLTLGGMPASPHQVAALMPRPGITEQAAAANLTKVDLSAR